MRHFRYFLLSSLAAFCLLFASCDLLFPDSENETDLTPEAGDNMYMGNPDDAGTSTTANAENYLLIKEGLYAVSYNSSRRIPNLVSWHLDVGDFTSGVRYDGDFFEDEGLPASWYRVDHQDYTNSGFDRGHMCPNADRNSTYELSKETFYTTNIVPQAPRNNQNVWKDLEEECRDIAQSGNELYIIAGVWDDSNGGGGVGSQGAQTWINDADNEPEYEWVCVPEYLWKVILVMDESDEDDIERASTLNCDMIAIWIPNTQDSADEDWTYYAVPVDEVEEKTGYDFFENLPDDVEDYLERQAYTGAEV